MERVCFQLQVRPDRLEEYRARHRAVWPEMLDALRERRLAQLLALPARRRAARRLPRDRRLRGRAAAMDATEVNVRWQREMAPFFELPRRAAATRCCGWRRSSTLPDGRLRRRRPRARERPRRRRALRRRPRRARRGPPLPQPAGAPARRPALEPAARCSAESLDGLRAAPGPVDGVGVDAWGVDYALLDARGRRARPALPLPRRAHRRAWSTRAFDARPRATSSTRRPASRRCRSTPSSSCSPTRAAARSRPRRGSRSCPTCWPAGSRGELANERTRASHHRPARRAHRRLGARRRSRGSGLPARALRRAGRPRHDARPAARGTTGSAGRAARARRRGARHGLGVRRRAGASTPHAAILSSGTWSLLGLELRRAGARARRRARPTSPTSAASTARRGC